MLILRAEIWTGFLFYLPLSIQSVSKLKKRYHKIKHPRQYNSSHHPAIPPKDIELRPITWFRAIFVQFCAIHWNSLKLLQGALQRKWGLWGNSLMKSSIWYQRENFGAVWFNFHYLTILNTTTSNFITAKSLTLLQMALLGKKYEAARVT